MTASPVPDTPSDLNMSSFDGTKIRIHWFPVDGASKDKPAPTVLMGPGWSLPGDTSVDGAALFGAASIKGLHDHGYNVLTWDPRGFGRSGGVVTTDDPKFEGHDVQVMMDWVASQPQAQLDHPGDPRVGMIGFSYGGGIQLAVAPQDCRVDALVPGLAWHSLVTSLYKADTVKTGWSKFLYQAAVAAGGTLDPHLVQSATVDLPKGVISPENLAWYKSRGPGDRIDQVDVPTLFVSGTVDTLFTLDEVISNYESLKRRGVPTGMVWFCGGHGACLTPSGDDARFSDASIDWLDRYLKGDRSAKVGPELDLVDQDGKRWTAPSYPPKTTGIAVGKTPESLELTADGGSGPVTIPPGKGGVLGGIVAPFTPAKAAHAVNVKIDGGDVDGLALGAPQLTLTYSGTAGPGDAPTRAFAQLVDDDTGLVVGNQVTPFQVTLDGKPHNMKVAMEVIAQHVRPGHTMTLQLVATTTAYAVPRLGGSIDFTKIDILVPIAKGMKLGG